MREARLILPNADNDAKPLTAAHAWLKGELIGAFGGYTATPSQGGWRGPDGRIYEEAGTAYDIACEEDGACAAYLRKLAQRIGRMARQEAVYLRQPNGVVEIVDTHGDAALPLAA